MFAHRWADGASTQPWPPPWSSIQSLQYSRSEYSPGYFDDFTTKYMVDRGLTTVCLIMPMRRCKCRLFEHRRVFPRSHASQAIPTFHTRTLFTDSNAAGAHSSVMRAVMGLTILVGKPHKTQRRSLPLLQIPIT